MALAIKGKKKLTFPICHKNLHSTDTLQLWSCRADPNQFVPGIEVLLHGFPNTTCIHLPTAAPKQRWATEQGEWRRNCSCSHLSCVRLFEPISWQECWMPAIRYGTNLWIEPLSCTAPETPWATLILSVSLRRTNNRKAYENCRTVIVQSINYLKKRKHIFKGEKLLNACRKILNLFGNAFWQPSRLRKAILLRWNSPVRSALHITSLFCMDLFAQYSIPFTWNICSGCLGSCPLHQEIPCHGISSAWSHQRKNTPRGLLR